MITSGGTTTLGLYDNASEIRKKADITYVDSRVGDFQAQVVSLAGGHLGYATLTLATTASTELPANTVVEVTNDPDPTKNGLYLWNGTTLTKSAYDPLTQAKASDKKSTNITMKTIAVSGNTAVQLSDVENNKYLVFIGNLLSNATITFPNVLAEFTVQNSTQGGFDLLLKTESATYTQPVKSSEITEVVTTPTEVRIKDNLKARLNSPVFTGSPKAPTPNALPNDNIANVRFVKNAAHGALEIAVTGDMTLTDDQILYKNLIFIGSLSSDATIQIASAGQWNMRNATTGGFSLNIKSVGQPAPAEVVRLTDSNTYHINSTVGITRFVLTKSQTKGNKSISLAGLTDLNISADDALRYESFYFGGTLTQDVTVVFPKQAGSWIVRHQASGGFRIYVKTLDSTISPIQLSNADNIQVVSDGINLQRVGGSSGGSATLIENYRGVHVLGSSYSIGDIIEHGSGIYRCVVAQSNVASPQNNAAFKKIQHNALSGTNTKIATKSVTMQNHTGIKTVIGQSSDGMTWFSGDNWKGLFESKDFGATWTMVKNFGNGKVNIARQLGNGEMLCDFADQDFTPFKRQIWVSSGYGTSNLTWTKVLETQVENVHFNDSWGFHDYNNIVLLADYGNKYMPDGGGTVIEGESSRYAYLSTDYGKTFTQIFDLNDYTDGIGVHLHGIVYDQYWNRIWLSHGDGYYGSNGLWYSDDLGKTWQSALETSGAGRNFTQSVGIVCLPTCILFASDSFPNGIQRLDRSQGKIPVRGFYTVDGAYTIPDSSPDALNYLCKSFSQARFIPDAPVIFSFAPEVLSGKSTIIATYNGWEFFELWTDDEVRPTAKGLNRIVGVTRQNEIICRSNDNRYGTGTATRLILSV